VKAEIKWIIDDDLKNGLWMIIDEREMMWAIEEDEVEPIRDACNKYLAELTKDK
jgi:hypothetical protein